MICFFLFTGCEQVSKSIKDTFQPKVDTIAVEKQQIPDPVPYDAAVERQIEDAQRLVETVLEKHTKAHVQYIEGKNTDFLTNEKKLNRAEEALKKLPQYLGKEIFIYSSIHFYNEGKIRVMLQHPQNPEYIDNYVYENETWSDPEQLSVKDNIRSRLISLQKISFTNVAKAASVYNEKIKQIEGAEPITGIYISVWDNNLRWSPASINGSRERYSIELNQNGTLKKFERE
ncbi:hypothetical protein PMI13_03819 [Chryseobacterium populi]|uniref:Uncharacterized protein n=2 Tax=Chryseobacterium populi TaxID=1144316 RepID=J3CBS8_9FLAO|nr:hypothetical protein PMI13_03819 [Chryseobacterium populi]